VIGAVWDRVFHAITPGIGGGIRPRGFQPAIDELFERPCVSIRPNAASPRPAIKHLPLPAAVNKRRILWPYAITVGLYHLVALLALFPWFFSWTGVALAIAGIHVFGHLGIGLGYHRLLTHRGLVCPKWLEHGFAILGVCSMQDTPARWVAVHRRHHEQSDRQDDPHSPLVNAFWGHAGWMLVDNRDLTRLGIYDRYAKDVLRDPFYRRLERTLLYPIIVLSSWAVFFLGGLGTGLLIGCTVSEAVRLGASLLIWGVFVRTVLVWHVTWSVNSISHLFGYQNYETGDQSRNNWLVAILTNGEGWHNNHHADARSARHGRRWWEIDLIFAFVWALEMAGLAWNVSRPDQTLTAGLSNKKRMS
jgi:fatty-acid desaturase